MADLDTDVYSLLLAQSDAQGLPGQTTTAQDPAAGAAGGGGGAPAGRGGGGAFGTEFFILMVVLIAGMFLMSMMGQRRERKKRDALLSSIQKHDRVQTVGGVIGAIVEIKPDTVVLKVDESSNTRITFARSSVTQVLSSANRDSPS